MKMTTKEEEIMQILWQIKKGFVKDIIAQMEEPKPHYNTTSTLIRIMEDKGLVGHIAYGKTHEYYPILSEQKYKKNVIGKWIEENFAGSYKNLVTFFAKEEKLSSADLEEILKDINSDKS